MRLRKPHTTATIWPSGKITCAGARSESDAYKAARRYCRLLQKMQFRVKLNNYRVVNVLATCTMPFGIDIIRIANKFQKECSYEPELHPGATFKLSDIKTTLKLFTTGSVTLTAPSVSVAQQAVNRMYPILYEYRRNAPPNTSINSNNNGTNHIKNEQIINIKNEQLHFSQLQPQQQQQQQYNNNNTSNSLPFMNSQTSSMTRINSSENGSSSSDSTSSISSSSSSSSLLTNNHSVFNAPNSNHNQHHTYFNNDISLTPHLLYETFSCTSFFQVLKRKWR